MKKQRHISRLDLRGRPAALAKQHLLQPQDQRAECHQKPQHQYDGEQFGVKTTKPAKAKVAKVADKP